MKPTGYTRRRFTYSFRAWVDEHGSNKDRRHTKELGGRCNHIRLWDLNTQGKSRNLLRIERRRRPFLLRVTLGPRYWQIVRVGADGLLEAGVCPGPADWSTGE